jgi:tRNA A37 threonylcarbamoyltransferase TsaD
MILQKIILYINTTAHDEIIIALRSNGSALKGQTKAQMTSSQTIAEKKIKAVRNQAEKLVPAIETLLKKNKVKLSALTKIIVAPHGGSFTSLRIGVITANALAFALKIPVEAEPVVGADGQKIKIKTKKFGSYSIIEPSYDREPNIGVSKKPKL